MTRLAVALALAALAGGAWLATTPAAESTAAAEDRQDERVIAKARSTDLLVKLIATRDRLPGEPDTATVRIVALERVDGDWDRLAEPYLVGQESDWFWHAVTGRRGVPLLRVARPGGECPDRVALRLLLSPSAGSSATFRFATCDGEFHPVDV